MTNENQIKIFVTGGTIDDLEYPSLDDAPDDPKTHIADSLKTARINVKYNLDILMMKDSKFITEEDRIHIKKECQECNEDRIVITHGTGTLVETAQFLGKQIDNKTIVLVGSMIPINAKQSDAHFNLGAAIAAVQLLPKGVYVVMNGRVFNWNNVRKNRDKGVFEEVE